MSPKKEVATQKNTSSTKKSVNKKTTKSDRYVSPKNYFYAFLILIGGILLALYVFEWYQVKKEEKLMTSYLISSNTIESNIKDFCTGCFTGKYPIEVPDEIQKDRFEKIF